MAEDKVIKSGQLTIPRLAFLGLCGLILFVIVATGQLAIGYLLITGVLCLLLLLVTIDYRVSYEAEVKPSQSQQQQTVAAGTAEVPAPVVAAREARPRRRGSRPAKRRR